MNSRVASGEIDLEQDRWPRRTSRSVREVQKDTALYRRFSYNLGQSYNLSAGELDGKPWLTPGVLLGHTGAEKAQ